MSLTVELEDGGRGTLEGFDGGEVASAVLPRAFAPGAPLSLRVQGLEEPLALQGKTIGSKRREDGHFDVRLRLINLRRADRQRLRSVT